MNATICHSSLYSITYVIQNFIPHAYSQKVAPSLDQLSLYSLDKGLVPLNKGLVPVQITNQYHPVLYAASKLEKQI
jgi:hypothetical protein